MRWLESRVWRRRAAVAIVGAVVAFAAAPQVAAAAPLKLGFSFPTGFVDFQPAAGPQPGPLPRIRADAVRRVAPASDVIKAGLPWVSVQHNCSEIRRRIFHWELIDRLMVLSHDAGARLMFVLRSPPACASARRRLGLEPRGPYRGRFAGFARKVLERYGPGGKFFDRYGDDYPSAKPVTLYEIWNEPNLSKKWSTKNPRDFGRFMIQVSRSMRGANNWKRRVKVIHGGLAGLYAERWLRRLYPLRRFNRLVDGIGLHTYAPSPRAALRVVAGARRQMRAGRHRAPIYVTEHGWATCPQPDPSYPG